MYYMENKTHFEKILATYKASPEKFLIKKTIQLIADRQTAVNADHIYNALLRLDIKACKELLYWFGESISDIQHEAHIFGAKIMQGVPFLYAGLVQDKANTLKGLFAFIVNYDNDILYRFEDLDILKDFLTNIAANENYYDSILDAAYTYIGYDSFFFFKKKADIDGLRFWRKALVLEMPKGTAISTSSNMPQPFDCVATNYNKICKIIKFV